jgi:GDP-mannose 4,6-dehydratase
MAVEENQPFRNVLITGINGSGGYYLAKYILDNFKSVNVFGLSRWRSGFSLSKNEDFDKVKIIECDMNDFSSLARCLDTSSPDLIFNMASHANVKVSFETPLSVLQNNIFSTANLLEAIRLSGSKCLLVHCSTSEVYGKVKEDEIPITESTPIRPASPYAVSKTTQDLLCDVYFKSFGIKIIRTRMFGYINPRRDDLFATAFAKQVVQIENGKAEKLYHGNLESIRTLIGVRDAAESYWLAALHCDPGEAYNIGGLTPVKVGDCLKMLASLANKQINTECSENLLRPNDVTLQIPSSEKFLVKTNWKQRIPLNESLEFLLNFWRNKV